MSNIPKTPVDEIIGQRKSIRAYLKTPVKRELIEHILETASRAPSASNMQPWKVYVLTGAKLKELTDTVSNAFDEQNNEKYQSEYPFYPAKHFEPYLSRRRKMGYDMYGILNIQKGDREKSHRQQRLNYEFFGAPVGLIFTMNRNLPYGSFVEYGAFLDNIMLSALSHGLSTCTQAGWSSYHTLIRKILPIPDEEMLLAGMALGYADTEAPIYKLTTEREPLSSFVSFFD